jgi:hypothetical protein
MMISLLLLLLAGEKRNNMLEGLLALLPSNKAQAVDEIKSEGLIAISPKKVDQVFNLLNSDYDLNEAAVAAIMGNISAETGDSFDFTQQQKNGPGYGLFQFEGVHQREYDNFLEENKIPDSAKSQIDYVMENIYGSKQDIVGQGNAKLLREAFERGDVDLATEIFMTKFERPKDQSNKKIQDRIKRARSFITDAD